MEADIPSSIDEESSRCWQGSAMSPIARSPLLSLSLKMGKPLFLEGEAGVGKTEIAKVLSSALDRRLVRLQCYEGLDLNSAVYGGIIPVR